MNAQKLGTKNELGIMRMIRDALIDDAIQESEKWGEKGRDGTRALDYL